MGCFRFRLFSLFLLAVAIAKWSVLGQEVEETWPKRPECRIDPDEVDNLFDELWFIEDEREEIEEKLVEEGKVIQNYERLADISHLRSTREDPLNREKELKQIIFEAVSNRLIEKYNLSPEEVNECLPKVPLNGESSASAKAECLEFEFTCQCDPRFPYRNADGTCNNLMNPTWGAVGSCFERTLPPRYVGVSGFRQSANGGPLPQPRDLSLNIHSHLERPTHDVSHMYMFFGQLIDHEITQAPISITLDNLPIKCCVSGDVHPQCIPLSIRRNDTFYSEFDTTCINVVRAALCPTCKLGPRQQINQITSFVDGSVVYGTSHAETRLLRTNDGTGRMRVQRTRVGDLLPQSPDPENDQCSFVDTDEICFQAGDPRANEHAPLAALQTIFVREHNRLADGLRDVNPSWDDDKLFQEAKKIVGAIMQVIVYQEYLPITLGDEQLDFYQLRVYNNRTVYEPEANPNIKNEFTAAAFRFSHSLINSILANAPLNSTNGPRLLRDNFFQPFDLYKGILSPLVASTTSSPAQEFDRHLVPDVTNFLYRIRGTPAGLDLAAINIHRGRDHGIPTYADMVRFCSGYKFKQFTELVKYNLISKENRDLLAQNYKSVEDIDLWTGLLTETPLPGAIVGPTTACIVGSQFRNLKYGDRFYFEHTRQTVSFTQRQVPELKKMSLSKLICLNTDNKQLTQNALLLPSKNNPPLDCSSVKGINLSLWKSKN